MKFLKRHPFATRAWFERVVAVSFAFPAEVLRPMVSAGLELDVYEGLGFLTVAMVWTKQLRPAVLPAFCGQDFFLAGYRIFTTLRDETGRRLRGLRILRSETDQRRMVTLGNIFTHYRYRFVEVAIERDAEWTRVRAKAPAESAGLEVVYRERDEAALPVGSPFPDWKTARRFAGPMPFTFSKDEEDDAFVVIEGSRQHWTPRPAEVEKWSVPFFSEGALADATPVLANAFTVEGVPYRWGRGRLVPAGGGA